MWNSIFLRNRLNSHLQWCVFRLRSLTKTTSTISLLINCARNASDSQKLNWNLHNRAVCAADNGHAHALHNHFANVCARPPSLRWSSLLILIKFNWERVIIHYVECVAAIALWTRTVYSEHYTIYYGQCQRFISSAASSSLSQSADNLVMKMWKMDLLNDDTIARPCIGSRV